MLTTQSLSHLWAFVFGLQLFFVTICAPLRILRLATHSRVHCIPSHQGEAGHAACLISLMLATYAHYILVAPAWSERHATQHDVGHGTPNASLKNAVIGLGHHSHVRNQPASGTTLPVIQMHACQL